MKYLVAIALICSTTALFAQRDMTPGTDKSAFGKVDLRNLSLTGLQVQFGPAYSFAPLKKTSAEFNDGGSRGNYEIDPQGRFGGFLEVGLAHFTKKERVWLDYYDYGLGFKYLGGKEKTEVNYTDILGNVTSTSTENGSFYNGYLYGRFSLHKHLKHRHWRRVYLDNSLGVNVDYRIITADQASNYHNFTSQFSEEMYYHKPLVAQLNAGVGLGVRLRKGTNLIVGVHSPVMGFYEWNKAKPALRWFSNDYWPVLLHVKVINLFQKRSKGSCNGVDVNEEDKKRNDQFMQGN